MSDNCISDNALSVLPVNVINQFTNIYFHNKQKMTDAENAADKLDKSLSDVGNAADKAGKDAGACEGDTVTLLFH